MGASGSSLALPDSRPSWPEPRPLPATSSSDWWRADTWRPILASDELGDDPLRLGERLELMEIEALLLQRPHEALDDAAAPYGPAGARDKAKTRSKKLRKRG